MTLELVAQRIATLESQMSSLREISRTQEVKYSLRQSMWKKTKNVLDIVRKTGVITIPGLHFDKDISKFKGNENTIIYNKDQQKIKDIEEGDLNKDQQKIKDIEEGDLIVIFENGNKKRALLVRMKGKMEHREVSNVLIYRKEGFNNGYTQGQDVIQVSLDDFTEPSEYTSNNPMYAYIREVEIVREINKEEALFQKYWKFQGHIQRNRALERFIEV